MSYDQQNEGFETEYTPYSGFPAEHAQEEKMIVRDLPEPRAESREGRLFGWLVSYADPAGKAIELREGKFFVSRSSLKSNDLILEDESVSTPHAMVTVNPQEGFCVQDLMSSCGLFVRRRGEESYSRDYYTTTLEHGDWVRFGGVEFVVSLIAHVGSKH